MNTDTSLETVTELTDSLLAATAQWGLKVLGAIVLLIVGRMVAGWARKLVRKACERAKWDATLVPFISGMAYYGVLVAVLIAALGMVGVQTASLLAILGAAGLAIGLALQGTLSNIAAGVMLLIFRPFRVGEYVELANTAGSVELIGLFMTALNTPDNIKIYVPNSKIWGDTIKNYAANKTRRIDLVVGISYDDDIEIAKNAIASVLK
ncbi:MAG: mechanosensitive ion channel, partial [Gammaproteobacteria bacterium]|nr:mechanosensitive ion channel [Gammaproteobacteria bacterium]